MSWPAEKRTPFWYPGWVVDREDPDQNGRVRLLVPDLLGVEVTTDWAEPLAGPVPAVVVGDDRLGGMFVPPVGSRVRVVLGSGNIAHPKYLHGYYHVENQEPLVDGQGDGRLPPRFLGEVGDARADDQETGAEPTAHTLKNSPEPYAGKYPDCASFLLPGGFLVEFDATKGARRFKITHHSGWVQEIEEDGTAYVRYPAKVFEVFEDVVERIYKKGLHEVVVEGGASFKVAKGDRALEVTDGENHETYKKKSTEKYEEEREITVTGRETRKYEDGLALEVEGTPSTIDWKQKLTATFEQDVDVTTKAKLTLTAEGEVILTLQNVTAKAADVTLEVGNLAISGVATLNGKKIAKDRDSVVGDTVRAE